MGDSPQEDGKTGSTSGKGKLSLNRSVDAGHVKQNFGSGRSKSVLVEKKKKRFVAPARSGMGGKLRLGEKKPAVASPVAKKAADSVASPEGKPAETVARPAAPASRPAMKAGVKPKPQRKRGRGSVGKSARDGKDSLSNSEMDARLKALSLARQRADSDAEAARIRKEAEQRQAEEEARQRTEAEVAQKREIEENAAQEVTAKQQAEAEEARKQAEKIRAEKKKKLAAAAAVKKPEPIPDDIEATQKDRTIRFRPVDKKKVEAKPAAKKATPARPRLKNRLTINNFENRGRERSLASLRRRQQKQRKMRQHGGVKVPQAKVNREVVIPDHITIQELSNRMTERAVDVVKFLMKQGEMLQPSDSIDTELAELVVEEFGHSVRRVSEADIEIDFWGEDDVAEDLFVRAPVVTIMGHVDHGKTSLLDAIRKAKVADGESGGITQHIGAYQVQTDHGEPISFIDTPGHAAFTEMRSRGARVTDIVVLVVAANDGVMPQTIEAIHHAKAAEVPIIVAINKVDLPDANPDKVRTDLLQHELVVEAMGGDIQDVEVSAKTGANLEGLLEAIILQADVLELQANPERSAEGFVIEAKLERGRGTVATMLVQRGTLNIGNIIVAGKAWGRVRALLDDRGHNMKDAGPSMPVEVLGMDQPPSAGDQFAVVESEAKAREITEYRARKEREVSSAAGKMTSLEQMMSQLDSAKRKTFPLILKGDVQGSVEAIKMALEKLGNEEVSARIIHSGAGGISESDVNLARASGAVIMSFNVRANSKAEMAAAVDGIEIRYYSIIYDLIDDVKNAMSGMLDPTLKENYLGKARIQEVFDISKVGNIGGCRVTDGRVERGSNVRLIRDDIVIHEGTLSTLKRFKDEVKEVLNGQECGMAFTKYEDLREGDVIECFTIEKVARSL